VSTLQERDIQILEFISRFGYCQEIHISKLCSLSSKNTARIILRLINAGYVEKQKVLANTGAYMFLSKQGAQFLNVKPIIKVALPTLNHDTLLIDLYLYLARRYDNSDIIKTDKELRAAFQIDGSLSVEEKDAQRIPDLLINESIAIELELSEKPKSRLQSIINSYIISDNILEVHYYLQSLSLAQKIWSLTLGHPKFKFFSFELTASGEIVSINYEFSNTHNDLDSEAGPKPVKQGTKTFGGFVF
jgi:hypothetical protein